MVPDNGDSGAPIICDYFKDSSKKAIIGYCVARRGSTVETATGGWGMEIRALEEKFDIVPCT